MVVGIDVDGVLAHFSCAFQNEIVEVTGKDLFEPGDADNPPCWDWPQLRGYTDKDVGRAWENIKASMTFWLALPPTKGLDTLRTYIGALEDQNDVYYVTARPGTTAKRQTEGWLATHLYASSPRTPTVIMSADKDRVAEALSLDAYIDDNSDNAWMVACTRSTRSYLLNKSYNRGARLPGVIRVDSLGEFLDAERERLGI